MIQLKLSTEQMRLWIESERNAKSVLLHTHLLYTFKGNLDVPWFKVCINRILQQESVFNAYLKIVEGIPQLCIRRYEKHALKLIKLSRYPSILDVSDEIKYIEKEANQPIDLCIQPNYRITLYRSKHKAAYYFSCVLPHILIDAYSCQLLFDRLASLYNKKAQDQPYTTLNPINQEADFTDDRLKSSRHYWENQLKGPTLGLDFSRMIAKEDPNQQESYVCEYRHLSATVLKEVNALAKKIKTTPFLIGMTLYAFILHRYTGQMDFSIVYPINHRKSKQKKALGHHVNLLPLQFCFQKNLSLLDLIKHVTQQRKSDKAHDAYPYALIHRFARRHHQDTFNLLFSKTLFFPNFKLEGLEIEHVPLKQGHVGYGLGLLFDTHKQGALFCLEYDAHRFPSWFAKQLLDHFIQAIGHLKHSIDQCISSYPLLNKAELQTIMHDAEPRYTQKINVTPLGDRLDQIMDQFPERIAITHNESQMTYQSLKQQVNQVAHYLRSVGVKQQARVALLLERQTDYIVAILALVKLGCTYVPIDKRHPKHRIRYMLSDSGVQYALHQGSYQTLCTPLNIKMISIKAALDETEQRCLKNADLPQNALMYIIYTSGTTGCPKGVPITYEAIDHLFAASEAYFKFTHYDTWSLTHSFAFDFSVWELWGALLHGATLSLVPDNTRQDPMKFYHHIAENKITVCNITPSAFKNLIAIDKQEKRPLSLRYVIFGGEKLIFSDITPWLAQHGDKQPELINMYGLTEAPIHATYHKIHQNDGSIGSSLIGKPLPSIEMSIVDIYGNKLPRGVYGEIQLSSPYMTKGYLNLKAVNQAKFLDHPLGGDQSKIYKTGDYACWLQNGEINFSGRMDQQVQLNGYRIELEEINQVLQQHASVETAISMLYKGENAQQSIITFCIVQSDTIGKPDLYALAKEKLSFYMIPADIIFIEEIPLTTQGKVDYQHLKRIIESQSTDLISTSQPESDLVQAVKMIWQDTLGIQGVALDKNYFDQGGDSISLIRLHHRLEQLIDKKIALQDLFFHTTIRTQTEYLAKLKKKNKNQTHHSVPRHQALPAQVPTLGKESIAIIGLSIHVPGASTADQFLENVTQGKESIHFFSKEALGLNAPQLKSSSYVKAKGYLDKADYFDADFFDYNSHEATLLDPQHRLLLEYSWSALESAGYVSEEHAGKIGVFVGQSNVSSYYTNYLFQQAQNEDLSKQYQILLNNSPDFLANRLAYKLNLTGPAMTVQTGCSTSLVAVCRAIQSLRTYECAMAIAGGVCLTFPLKSGYEYQSGMILSQDGHCRPFDQAANGTVPGNGIGIVILKRYAEARAAGDTIYAVIKGCAVNNDGHRKISFTAPSEHGQIEVIESALQDAEVAPDTVDFIEAHGTGTALGDPIEVNALTKAIFSHKKNKPYVLGSVKSNIGHLDAAAGVVGLIKTVLCLHQKVLAPTVHFKSLNPIIAAGKAHFNVLTRSEPWKKGTHPRRAGVSSFGIGGTNAHVILEEAKSLPSISSETAKAHLFILSAKTPKALLESCKQLADYLDRRTQTVSLSNIAYTLQLGRQHFPYRIYQVSESPRILIEQLRKFTMNQSPAHGNTVPAYYFMFPGQGAQSVGHMDYLYPLLPVFKETIIHCTRYLHQHHAIDLQTAFSLKRTKTRHRVDDDHFNQLYLFIMGYALAKQLMAWNIHPAGMIGHSLGEYVSACLADIWSLEDTLSILVKRQDLMNQLPEGRLLAISCGLKAIKPYLESPIAVAAINSPKRCTLSGPVEAIETLKNNLTKRGIACCFVASCKAYHSQAIDSIQEAFETYVQQFTCHAPRIPVISNVTGQWLTTEEAVSPRYWWRQMRQTVLFSSGLETLIQNNNNPVLIELGVGNHLSTFVHQHRRRIKSYSLLGKSGKHADPYKACLEALGQLWQSGADINWAEFNKDQECSRVSLPTYPFQRKRYSFERDPEDLLKKQDSVVRLYQPNWILAPQRQLESTIDTQDTYLLFHSVTSWSKALHKQLSSNYDVFEIYYGNQFKRSNRLIELRCHHQDDFTELFSQFKESGQLHIIYCWPTYPSFCFSSKTDSQQLSLCYQTLKAYLYLLQAVSVLPLQSIKITVFIQGLCFVEPQDLINPLQSVLLGPGMTLKNEIPRISHKIVDLSLDEPLESYVNLAIAELNRDRKLSLVVYRGMKRLVQGFAQVSLAECTLPPLKANGTYVITGGLGHIGLVFAEYLSTVKGAKIVLIRRRKRSTDYNEEHTDLDLANLATLDRDRFNRVKTRAYQLTVFQCDVTQYDQLNETFQKIRERYGKITGVIHAAGIYEGSTLSEINLSTIENNLRVKVDGVCNLHAVTRHDHLDFMLLCSALSALAGDYGQSIYNSANAFLDAFAYWRSFHHSPTVSVNWDAWTEGGMAKSWMERFHVDYDGIKDQEALSLIPKLLSYQGAQWVVTKQRWSKRIEDNFLETLVHQKSVVSMHFPLKHSKSSASIRPFIEQLWQQHLDYQPAMTSEHFHELGGDSLLAVQLASLLSNTYGIRIYPHTLIEYPTIDALSHYINSQIEPGDLQNKADSDPDFCLVSLTSPSKNKPNVFLIHPVGGTVHIYSDLASFLGKVANVYGIQAKALDGYSDPDLTITEMAAYYINCLKTVQATGDYLIGGASLGGLLAYEMAEQLSQQGDTVRLLFFMDTPSPEHYPKKISTYSEVMQYMLEVGAQHKPTSEFDTYSLEEQLNYFLKHAGKLKGTLPHFDHNHLKRYLTLYQHNMKAMLSHQLKPPTLNYPAAYYYRASIRTSHNPQHPETGWETLFKGNLEVINTPGNHITMLLLPFVSAIGEHLTQSIQNCTSRQALGEMD